MAMTLAQKMFELFPEQRKEITARVSKGQEHYGVELAPFRGNNAMQDMHEEALDMAFYALQAIEEGKKNNIATVEKTCDICEWFLKEFRRSE